MHAVAALQVDVNQGFEFRDLVVPLATFVGGLLGVIVRARLSHRTLHSVEKERTEREMQFERARERRELAAQQRQALGVARALQVELKHRPTILDASIDRQEWWPMQLSVAVDLRDEDEHRLASWLSESAWEAIATTLHILYVNQAERLSLAEDQNPPDARRDVDAAHSLLGTEITKMRESTVGTFVDTS